MSFLPMEIEPRTVPINRQKLREADQEREGVREMVAVIMQFGMLFVVVGFVLILMARAM